MPRLDITPFTDELLPLVSDFDCGSEDYQEEVAEWIRGQRPGTVLDAIHSRRRPARVWLYSTPVDGIVGYGSLGPSNWTSRRGGPRDMPIVVIPNAGLKRQFQRYPPDAAREERYSTQIMEHLKYEARNFPRQLPLLGLFVHPNNEAARILYARVGFTDYDQTYYDEEKDVTYQGMILKLAQPEVSIPTQERLGVGMLEPQEPAADSPGTVPNTLALQKSVATEVNTPPLPEKRAKRSGAELHRAKRKKRV